MRSDVATPLRAQYYLGQQMGTPHSSDEADKHPRIVIETLGGPRELLRSEMLGVCAWSYIAERPRSGGGAVTRYQRWAVSLATLEQADPRHALVAEFLQAREACLAGQAGASGLDLEGPLAGLAERSCVVVDSTSEGVVWQTAQRLARQLALPLFDSCSSPPLSLVPKELELSLGERLACGLQRSGAKAGVPHDASETKSTAQLGLSWRHSRWGDILAAAVLPGIFTSFALS